MNLAKRILVTCIVMLTTVSALGYFFWYKPKFKLSPSNNSFSYKKAYDFSRTLLRLKQKAPPAADFAKANNFNTTRCFLVDMQISSGLKRFFVYNLEKDSVEIAGLVTHGSGSDKGGEELYFSNTPNSNCTSLGKYKIGRSYFGKFGLSFKLYGLEKSNNNAFDRFVVLHSHSCVPNEDVSLFPICVSQGCPTVSPAFLTKLKTCIDDSQQPVLLWIYY